MALMFIKLSHYVSTALKKMQLCPKNRNGTSIEMIKV